MHSQKNSIDSTEDRSQHQLFTSPITRETMEKKISFRWHHILTHLLLGVGLGLVDIIGDIYSSFQLYNQQYEWNFTAQTERNCWHFPVSVCLLVIPSFLIMCLSLVTYWREEQSKLKLKGWGLLRWACHFPFFVLAPATRTVDLVILGYEFESLKLYNFGDELERCFKLLQKRDETFTRIQHWENCFESGPQLCLKIHFLFLHLIAGKDIFMGSYGFWNVFFIVVGIFSCAWKNVCNRKSLNLCSDQEKRMSWRKHIIPLFVAHSFSVFVRFTLLGALSALTLSGFGIFFVFHVTVILYYLVISGALLNLAQNRGSCWNPTENIIRLTDILTSSLFSFVEFTVLEDNKWRMRIYYLIPLVENVLLGFICLPMIPIPWPLRAFFGLAMISSALSIPIYKKMEDQRIDTLDGLIGVSSTTEVKDLDADLNGINIRQLDGNGGPNGQQQQPVPAQPEPEQQSAPPTLVEGNVAQVGGTDDGPISLGTNNADALVPKWKYKKSDETSAGTLRQRQLASKFQYQFKRNKKSFEEELQDAVERKNLIWLCRNYKGEDLVDIVGELVKSGADVDATDGDGDTALHCLCENYRHKNLIQIVRLLLENSGNPRELLFVNDKDKMGRMTAFQWLFQWNWNDDLLIDFVKLFIENGFDVYSKASGSTPIQYLLESSNRGDNLLQVLEFMIEKGAQMNPDSHKMYGRTALHWLCRYYTGSDLIGLVRSLIEKRGVDANAKDTKGRSALFMLCRNKYQGDKLETVQFFLNKGADVMNGADLLLGQCGCRRMEFDVIRLLMDRGRIPVDDPVGSKVKELLDEYQGNLDVLEDKLIQVYDEWKERRNKKVIPFEID